MSIGSFPTRTRLTALALATALALGAALALRLAAPPASAADSVPWNQVCPNAWDDSVASDHCTGAVIERIGSSTAGDSGHCRITSASCSLEITHGLAAFQRTETLTYDLGFSNLTQSPSDTEDLDLCTWASEGSYHMALRASCAANERTSGQSTGILPSP